MTLMSWVYAIVIGIVVGLLINKGLRAYYDYNEINRQIDRCVSVVTKGHKNTKLVITQKAIEEACESVWKKK